MTIVAIDPVCGAEVDDRIVEFHINHANVEVFFCSVTCQMRFETCPDRFLDVSARAA
jgi:YHS domain-containing protein